MDVSDIIALTDDDKENGSANSSGSDGSRDSGDHFRGSPRMRTSMCSSHGGAQTPVGEMFFLALLNIHFQI